MIRATQSEGSLFLQQCSSGLVSNFQGRWIEAIDLSSIGTKFKENARVIGFIAASVFALLALIWLSRHYCFKTEIGNDFPPESPYSTRIDDSLMPFVQKTGFQLPSAARRGDLHVLLERAFETFEKIDRKIGHHLQAANRWDFTKERGTFLKQIQRLKSFDRDYIEFKLYVDQIENGLNLYQDDLSKNPPDAETTKVITMLMDRIRSDKLAPIYARLAEKAFVEKDYDKTLFFALKMPSGEATREDILLAVAVRCLKENKQAEAQLALSNVRGGSPKTDIIYYDYISGIIETNARLAFQMVQNANWSGSYLADKLISKIAKDIFAREVSRSFFVTKDLLTVLSSMSDAEKKDKLLIHMGKVVYHKGWTHAAREIFSNMTHNIPLRDRFIYNINNNLPI